MSEEEKKRKSGISRREFLKDAGIVVGGCRYRSNFGIVLPKRSTRNSNCN